MKKIAAVVLALIAFSIIQPTVAYAGGLIDGGDIQNGSITGADIDNGTLTGVDVRNGTISNADLASGSVTSGKLGSGSVTTRAIATGQVTSDEIKDASVEAGDLSNGAIQYLATTANSIRGSGSAGIVGYGSDSDQFVGLFGNYQSGDLVLVFNAKYQATAPVRVQITYGNAPVGTCVALPFNGEAECQVITTASGLVSPSVIATSQDDSPITGGVDGAAIKVG